MSLVKSVLPQAELAASVHTRVYVMCCYIGLLPLRPLELSHLSQKCTLLEGFNPSTELYLAGGIFIFVHWW